MTAVVAGTGVRFLLDLRYLDSLDRREIAQGHCNIRM